MTLLASSEALDGGLGWSRMRVSGQSDDRLVTELATLLCLLGLRFGCTAFLTLLELEVHRYGHLVPVIHSLGDPSVNAGVGSNSQSRPYLK